jgi:methionyl-tRNA formyltransferase
MRVIFMGSPDLAVPSLRALVRAGHDICLAVTQPPHAAGRGRRERQPAVAVEAVSLGIDVFQPERVRRPEAVARLQAASPELIVVAAFGQILPSSILSIPRYGCVNVHPSLLPRHRGATPISGALLAGDAVTGVSIMLMDAGMDTGPVLAQVETTIADDDDQVTLTDQLARQGADLLVPTVERWVAGTLSAQPQDESQATLTPLTTRTDGALRWEEPARALWRRVRAYAEWPQGYTRWEGRLLRVRRAHLGEGAAAPGEVIPWGAPTRVPTSAAVGTGEGVLVLDVVGLEGRQLLPIDAFLRGQPRLIGARLETEGGQTDSVPTT